MSPHLMYDNNKNYKFKFTPLNILDIDDNKLYQNDNKYYYDNISLKYLEEHNNPLFFIEFKHSIAIDLKQRYNEEFETKLYQIISELFNNILKHSKASKALITIEEINNELIIIIEDKELIIGLIILI